MSEPIRRGRQAASARRLSPTTSSAWSRPSESAPPASCTQDRLRRRAGVIGRRVRRCVEALPLGAGPEWPASGRVSRNTVSHHPKPRRQASAEAIHQLGGPRGDRTHNPRIKRARVQGPRVSADVRLCWSGGYPWPRGPPRTVMNVVRWPPRWHHPSHWPGASHTDHARCKTAPPRCCDRDEALIPHHPQERRETHLQRSTTERLSLGPPVPSSTCRTRSCTGGRDSPSGGSRAGQRSRGRLRTPHPRGQCGFTSPGD